VRTYPVISKINTKASAKAAYPNYNVSNNYIVLPSNYISSTKFIDSLVEFSLYNWPINNAANASKEFVQTYYVKTLTEAFNEFKTTKLSLVHVSKWETMEPVNIDEISGMQTLEVMNVRMDFFENVRNTGYVQPVYQFVCLSDHNGKKYRLVFYVSAVKYKS
jgi:hypothetical protein